MCDYILFVEHKNILCGFVIEIKRGGKGGKSSTPQINAAEKFVKFIFNRARIGGLLRIEERIEKIRVSEKQLQQKERTRKQITKELHRDDDGFIRYTKSGDVFLINDILNIPLN